MQKTIRLSINGTDLAFDVTTELYNKYVNEMMPNNKVAPAHNFAMRCVADGSREDLKSLLELPGAAIQIAGALVDEFMPDLSIELGKERSGRKSCGRTALACALRFPTSGFRPAPLIWTAWPRPFFWKRTIGKRCRSPWRTA